MPHRADCVLPLPLAGEGWGEGPACPRSEALHFVDAPALTPGPSPASGRGEQTGRNAHQPKKYPQPGGSG
ncbi:hypothetical protein CO2235_MP90101 [Cupriavidus oxalaticus]|uniref:Uncharacterized protein n=1 Tax=Cupriavidus oxalaticus TaxID=96344 RepID=A0A375GL04_9BURK|nr:hypothetical protein CO2235_MP90101 [Cupriavidus oxalaticus]